MPVAEPSRWGAGPLSLTDGGVPALDGDLFVGQVRSTFIFRLLDGPTGERLGEIHPSRTEPPTLTHDTSRTIVRQLGSLVLDGTDTARIDEIRHRVDLAMLVGDVEYPLGRYMFSDVTRFHRAGAVWSSSTMLDEMFLVDHPLDTGFSVVDHPVTGRVIDGIDTSVRRLVTDLPFEVLIEPTPFYSGAAWPAGTQRGQVLGDLALLGDYMTPWFGNDARLHLVRTFDPATSVIDFDWDASRVVNRDSVAEVNDLLTAPNRVVVVSNDVDESSGAEVFGTYDLPASAPHSESNRGFVVPEVLEMQVLTTAQATAVAASIGQRLTVLERVELTTSPDPRHDSYDVIRWRGVNWLELAWSLPCQPGGEMSHTLRRAYP